MSLRHEDELSQARTERDFLLTFEPLNVDAPPSVQDGGCLEGKEGERGGGLQPQTCTVPGLDSTVHQADHDEDGAARGPRAASHARPRGENAPKHSAVPIAKEGDQQREETQPAQ
eukprot:s7566_g5.t1